MRNYAPLASLLLAVAVGCGQGSSNSEPAPAADQTEPQAAPAGTEAAAAATPDPTDSPAPAQASDTIEAGEALETAAENPAATRADTLLAAAVAPARPATSSPWQARVHYQLLVPAQPTNAPPEKVEVVYVFWYGCGHCFALDPFLQNWKKEKKAPYVEFTRLPVMWGPAHRAHARLFYTLAALGKGEELHAAVFREFHTNRNMLASNDPIETEQMQMQFAKRHGVSEEDFRKAYNSFAVETNLQRAEQLTRRYQVTAVPLMVINGKYTADVGSAGGQNQLIALIDDLAAREQKKE